MSIWLLWYNDAMAEHKVPQDVEADDKLIGPFSFRQFCYLMVAAAAGFLAFVMGQVAIPLAFIPAPVCVFFLVIALPLRKDQPMEIYLAALIRYYFRPRIRLWTADGEQPFVEISNPTTDDTPRTKDLAGDEVSRRLSFLANLSDTQGWSTRGLSAPVNNTNLNDEFANDAANAEDIMEDNALTDSLDNMLDKSERKIREGAINAMKQAAMPAPITLPNQLPTQPVAPQPAYMMPPAALPPSQRPQPARPIQPAQSAPNLASAQPLMQPVYYQPQPVQQQPISPLPAEPAIMNSVPQPTAVPAVPTTPVLAQPVTPAPEPPVQSKPVDVNPLIDIKLH